ncbi:hypothetical protein ACIQCF_07580 [Streptomyces sp. NPDC088353]|uniref:hypothetical protein n=1 Tax=Streptomyces sp. NPDC088353 TaxID=3365855 RepID=UPI0038026A68
MNGQLAFAAVGVLAAGLIVAVCLTSPRQTPRSRPAVLDTEPGINLADRDVCELLWAMPDYDHTAARLDERLAADPDFAAGLDRLRRAVRNEQQKGEQA